MHLHRGGRGGGAVVIGCDARINPAVLRHQIADLQGDFSGLTRETKRMPSNANQETTDGEGLAPGVPSGLRPTVGPGSATRPGSWPRLPTLSLPFRGKSSRHTSLSGLLYKRDWDRQKE